MVTVLLVEEGELLREGLKVLLATQPDLQVVGEADSVESACVRLQAEAPDVVIVASEIEGVGPPALTRALVQRAPSARVLVLSARGDPESVHHALGAGARGVALKSQPSAQLFAAVRALAQGQTYLAPPISQQVMQEQLQRRRGTSPCDVLSRRERDVFELLVRGQSNRRIAGVLGISPKTVETHRAHVLRKLGVHSVVELVRFCARHQLPLD